MSQIYKYCLFVEGRDDQYVLQSLLKRHRISAVIPDRLKASDRIEKNTISIEQWGGFETLRKRLFNEIRGRKSLERVGIIVDADDPDNPLVNISNRWLSLKDVLNKFENVTLPDAPNPEGTISTLQRPDSTIVVSGIWIMPDNQLPGTLEDFVKFLVPADKTSLWARAEGCVDSIPDEERLFRPIHKRKAHLATWLAWQKSPGIPLGVAISQRYLDTDTPHALKLIDWIRRLFSL